MVAPLVATVIGAQALVGFLNGRSAAAQAEAAASYNAQQSMATGIGNAANTEAFAIYNAGEVMRSANTNYDLIGKVAEHNAKVQYEITDYNSSLLDDEIARVWNDADLSMAQLSRQGLQKVGHQIATYAASGVMIGDGQSLDQAILDSQTQLDMDMSILRHNAEVSVGKLRDEQAKGEWQGRVAAQQIMYEGQVKQFDVMNNAFSQSSTIVKQGYYEGNTQRYNAGVQANSTLYNGAIESSRYKAAATQALVDGLFKYASVSTADKSMMPSTPSTPSTLTAPKAFEYNTDEAITSRWLSD